MKLLFGLLLIVSMYSTPSLAVSNVDVINNISYNVILKTYADFSQKSIELNDAVKALIASPTQENLVLAQECWKKARRSYEMSEGFLFGPIDSLGIDPMIDTWPLALTDLKNILTSNYPISTDFVRGLGADVQGFHAIEYVLFGDGVTSNTRSVTTISQREFQYLSATTELLVEQTNMLLQAWQFRSNPEDANSPAYVEVLANPSPNNPFYSSEQGVLAEFSSGIVKILNEASKAKLPDATGNSPGEANPALEESPFSWNSLNDFTSNVDSIYNLYTGVFDGQNGGGAGIRDLVIAKDPALAAQVEQQILLARQKIVDVAGPNHLSFGQAIKDTDGRTRIFAAVKELKKLQAMFENQVAPLLL